MSDTSWFELLVEIRELQTKLLAERPYRDTGLIPNPAARDHRIANAELRLGRPLPSSYRAFLERHDGWPRFFEGAALLGSRQLGEPGHKEHAQMLLDACEGQSDSREHELIVFGLDPQGTTVFAFDPQLVDDEGEMAVICWVQELGVLRGSFTEFLELVKDLCAAELDQVSRPEPIELVTRRSA